MSLDCDHLLAVPSRDTARIQECHEFVYHVIAGIVEEQLFVSAEGVKPLGLKMDPGQGSLIDRDASSV